jgi:glycosyltransferase involved in cell wall biosynthesis
MALGVVVVARAVGGIPDIIQAGVNGVLVNSSDPVALAGACTQMLDSPAQRQRLAEAGKITVANEYLAERAADKVIQLYNSLLAIP